MVPAIPLPRLADQVPHGAEGTTEASSQPFKSIISSYIRQRERETIIFSKHWSLSKHNVQVSTGTQLQWKLEWQLGTTDFLLCYTSVERSVAQPLSNGKPVFCAARDAAGWGRGQSADHCHHAAVNLSGAVLTSRRRGGGGGGGEKEAFTTMHTTFPPLFYRMHRLRF